MSSLYILFFSRRISKMTKIIPMKVSWRFTISFSKFFFTKSVENKNSLSNRKYGGEKNIKSSLLSSYQHPVTAWLCHFIFACRFFTFSGLINHIAFKNMWKRSVWITKSVVRWWTVLLLYDSYTHYFISTRISEESMAWISISTWSKFISRGISDIWQSNINRLLPLLHLQIVQSFVSARKSSAEPKLFQNLPLDIK